MKMEALIDDYAQQIEQAREQGTLGEWLEENTSTPIFSVSLRDDFELMNVNLEIKTEELVAFYLSSETHQLVIWHDGMEEPLTRDVHYETSYNAVMYGQHLFNTHISEIIEKYTAPTRH